MCTEGGYAYKKRRRKMPRKLISDMEAYELSSDDRQKGIRELQHDLKI